jgi:hypothetical protein
VIGTVAAAGVTAYAGSKAASAQENAANAADQTQLQMFNTTNAEQAPYRQAGGQALNQLSQFYGLGGVDTTAVGGTSTGPGGVTNSSTPDYNAILSGLPGYQFQMQQGTQAINQNLAAQGLLQSGAAGKELAQYGQGLASNYAQQYVGGLQSLAGLGQSSTQATGTLGQQTANQIGSNQIYAGNAQASSYATTANAINGGIGNIAGGLGYMNSPYSSGYSPYASPYSGGGYNYSNISPGADQGYIVPDYNP